MNFGEILSRSWMIFWKNKRLWLFGVIPLQVYSIYLLVVFIFSPAFNLVVPGFQIDIPAASSVLNA